MYNLKEYAYLVGDRVRMEAYAAAIRKAVFPGAVVADLGAGGGVLSVLAAHAGARRVYAIEEEPLASVVREVASRSGVGDIVRYVQGRSTEVILPERADVIVSDLHGRLPLYGGHLPSIMDARNRFLRSGGALVPARETLHGALVSAPLLYEEHIGVFETSEYRIDLHPLRELAVNRLYGGHRDRILVLGPYADIGQLDYGTISSTDLDASFQVIATEHGVGHGLCVWFDGEFAPGVLLTNRPDAPETVFGRVFFPFEQPLALAAGDHVAVRLRARLHGEEYVWTWETDATGTAQPVRFRQSTFRSFAIR